MNALDWRQKMKHAPRIDHDSDGEAVVRVGDSVAWFPGVDEARFFVAAYADVPNLTSQVASLQAMIDEGALNKALTANTALTAELEQIKRERVEMQAEMTRLAEMAATATRRARVLAQALTRAIK